MGSLSGRVFVHMTAREETFKKSERLCSRKIITGLIDNGNIFYMPFYKVIWTKYDIESPFPAQVAFGVPKRGFRHAVARNLLKRRMREAYRRNKHMLYDFLSGENVRIAFIVIFRADYVPDYRSIEESMQELINKFKTETVKMNI
jgi:ribonuclease P protein component